MAVGQRQGTVHMQDVVLCAQEALQVLRVRGHLLGHGVHAPPADQSLCEQQRHSLLLTVHHHLQKAGGGKRFVCDFELFAIIIQALNELYLLCLCAWPRGNKRPTEKLMKYKWMLWIENRKKHPKYPFEQGIYTLGGTTDQGTNVKVGLRRPWRGKRRSSREVDETKHTNKGAAGLRNLRPRETDPQWERKLACPRSHLLPLTIIQWPLGKGVWERGHKWGPSSPACETWVHSADQGQMSHCRVNCANAGKDFPFNSTNCYLGLLMVCHITDTLTYVTHIWSKWRLAGLVT